MSPTFAIEATSAGLILGTAGYMSPEQARGKPVDVAPTSGRSVVCSSRCSPARQVFETGETVSDAVAAILTREPDWNALPANLPAPIRRLLRRCLEKDPDRRLHHAADARLEIADAMSAPVSEPVPAPTLMPSSRLRFVPWAVTAVAVGLALVALWARSGTTASATSPVRRLELTLPHRCRTVRVESDASPFRQTAAARRLRRRQVRDTTGLPALARPVRGRSVARLRQRHRDILRTRWTFSRARHEHGSVAHGLACGRSRDDRHGWRELSLRRHVG